VIKLRNARGGTAEGDGDAADARAIVGCGGGEEQPESGA
jgi:hypothetical protein